MFRGAVAAIGFAACVSGGARVAADPEAAPSPPELETQDLTQLSLSDLANIKVTSVSKKAEERSRTPAAIYVLTQDDIRRSGATTLPEMLRLVPGVEVARVDSTHWSVGVRGFGDQFSKSFLVLIDGRSVYTPLFAGVFWAVQDTLLEDVERIEVIRGPGGTIWGANAVNGVINVITRKAADTHGVLASATGGRGADSTFTLQGDAYKGEVGQSVGVASFSPPGQEVVDDALEVSGGNLLATVRLGATRRQIRQWQVTPR